MLILARKRLLASRATPLIELLYVILVDKIQGNGGKPDESTTLEISKLARTVLPVWGQAIPDLREILLTVLKGSRHKADMYPLLGQVLKQLVPQGKADTEVPTLDLELLKAFGMYFRTESQGALQRLLKFASASKSPWVVQRLTPKVGDQQTTKSSLESLVKALVGRKDTALTIDEAKKVKETKPEQYRAYLALRKEFNQVWKDALVTLVRKSGEPTIPYQEALQYMKLNGIDHLMPTGFTGNIDDLFRLYTKKGAMIDGVPNAVTFPSVTMNPNFGKPDGGDWVFMANRVDGSPGPYFYTSAFKKSQSTAKFTKVADLSGKMEAMRKKWFQRVRQFDETNAQCVASVVLEILFEFAARIGSVGNAAGGQSTYGVATLLVKHAIIDPSGNITLRYKGKDGVPTVHKLLKSDPYSKFVILALNQLLANKEPRDRIFTVDKGKRKIPLTAVQVNNMFKSCGAPAGVTVHKIRTYMGTKIFTELMNAQFEKPRQPKTEKDAMVIFQKMAEVVGKKLNHVRRLASGGMKVTGVTALNAYIAVESQLLFWHSLNLRVPKYLEKFSQELGTENRDIDQDQIKEKIG